MIPQCKAVGYQSSDQLRDGRQIMVRVITPEDKPVLQEVMEHLSPMSRYFRFLYPKESLTTQELSTFTDTNCLRHVSLVASIIENGQERPLGVGEYFVSSYPPDCQSAELAFAVEEEYQGLGVATLLLRHLTDIARTAGLVEFTALVHPDNKKMLEVFSHFGLPISTEEVLGAVQVYLRLDQASQATATGTTAEAASQN